MILPNDSDQYLIAFDYGQFYEFISPKNFGNSFSLLKSFLVVDVDNQSSTYYSQYTLSMAHKGQNHSIDHADGLEEIDS